MAESQASGVLSKLKGFGDKIASQVASATNAFATKINETSTGLVEDDSHMYGALWEANENVSRCRDCGLTFMPPVRTKHHCRFCASVYCVDCLNSVDINSNSVAKSASSLCQSKEETVKICRACQRGECPGDDIKGSVRSAIEKIEKQKQKRSNPLTEARERAAAKGANTFHEQAAAAAKKKASNEQPKQQSTVDKLATRLGDKLGVLEVGDENRPSVTIALSRGVLFGRGVQTTPSSVPPIRGYFELLNKSSEVFCAKLLIRGGNPLFEASRPSFYAVPPTGVLSALFETSQEHLELIVLFENPSPPNASMVFDTRSGWTGALSPDRISQCAAVGRFKRFKIFKINADESNVMLKYKGNGAVEVRNGDSMSRIGLIAKLAGKRHAPGEIDYDFNISAIHDITPES